MKLILILFSIMVNTAFANENILTGANLVAIKEVTAINENKKLIYFWATWCSTCEEKLKKVLPEMKKKHPDTAIVTLSMDTEEQRIKSFVEKKKIDLPVYYDPTEQVRKNFKIVAVPYWMVFKRDHGGAEWKQIRAQAAFDITLVEEALK